VAAAIAVRSLFRRQAQAELGSFGPVWPVLFLHAVVTGRLAAELARGRRTVAPDVVFMAGLLHDVGKSVALRSLAALEAGGKLPPSDDLGAARLLHQVHVPVGAEMQRKVWNLPPLFADVAAHHHDGAVGPGDSAATVHLVRLVSACDLLRAEPELHPAAGAEVLASVRALSLSPAKLALVGPALDEAEDWVGMLFGGEASPKALAAGTGS
jgi:putative nucleotidyltransferase with HDIG domain